MNNGINNIIKFNIVAACLMSSYMIVRRFLLYTSIYSKQIVSGYVDVKRVNNETKEKTPTAQTQRDHSLLHHSKIIRPYKCIRKHH